MVNENSPLISDTRQLAESFGVTAGQYLSGEFEEGRLFERTVIGDGPVALADVLPDVLETIEQQYLRRKNDPVICARADLIELLKGEPTDAEVAAAKQRVIDAEDTRRQSVARP